MDFVSLERIFGGNSEFLGIFFVGKKEKVKKVTGEKKVKKSSSGAGEGKGEKMGIKLGKMGKETWENGGGKCPEDGKKLGKKNLGKWGK